MGIFEKIFGNKSKEISDAERKIEDQTLVKVKKDIEVEKKINFQFNEFNNKYNDIKNKGKRVITINGEQKNAVFFNEGMFNNDSICVFVRRRRTANVISKYEEIVDFLYKRPNKSYEYYSIKVCDINHYEIIGEYHRDMKITGSSVSGGDYNIKKSAIGYAIAGPVGAVIGGKNKVTSEAIKTSYDVTDTRETVLYYELCDRQKKIIMPKEAYDSLKVIIPEKDIKNSAFKTRDIINEEIRKIENEAEQRLKSAKVKDAAINRGYEPIIQGVLAELKNSNDGLTIEQIKKVVVNEKYKNDTQVILDAGGSIENITQGVLLRARAKAMVKISDENLHNYSAIVTFVDESERDKTKKDREKALHLKRASALSAKYRENVKLLKDTYIELSDDICVISDRQVRETILDTDLTELVEILYGDVKITNDHKIKIEIIQNLLYIEAQIKELFQYRFFEYTSARTSSCMSELIDENVVERFKENRRDVFKIKNDFVTELYNKIKER